MFHFSKPTTLPPLATGDSTAVEPSTHNPKIEGSIPAERKNREKGFHLEKYVGYVVNDEDERADPGEVAGPGEAHEGNGGQVMNEHLPEVLPLHVEKLGDHQRPVANVIKLITAVSYDFS